MSSSVTLSKSSSSGSRVRDFLRKSIPFQKLPSFPSISFPEDRDEQSNLSASPGAQGSLTDIGSELRTLQDGLSALRQEIVEIREKNSNDLQTMTSIIKSDMSRLQRFGEQLDDLDQCSQMDKENIHIQMEEMEAKIHHQISDQYSDLQEAIERLYLRMESLEKHYNEQKQERDIEEKEASYIRHLIVKGINFFLTIAQVILVVVNTIAATIRPVSSNGANIAFICFVLFAIAVLNDEDVRKSTWKSLTKIFPALATYR